MRYLIIICLMLVVNISQAKIYVPIDMETGEMRGTVDVQADNIGEWSKSYTMKIADEKFRGKQGYEIKMDKGKLRLATKEEIEEYLLKAKQENLKIRKKIILDELGVTEEQLDKIKVQ